MGIMALKSWKNCRLKMRLEMEDLKMWCIYKSGVHIMVQDTKKRTKNGFQWVYIPEKQWLKMSKEQKARYIA